ncbi:leucine-rich repeat, immunoglobulin-like domain and transmembrane domain-containing protein 2 [Thalassophryne amazonica]|uniref:leucine-rich repeat, immunoglobulin-like domain and transmembrane domain-containing protein 2 n=1 Tax=Thalassophryne amazonica TaxID=390379 RepID=UPI0014721199|nr:leucine-rich repeat, immunoglobulin-like domain and transmembrane domain-containing protein 2 [Thalassophryne amazonica]
MSCSDRACFTCNSRKMDVFYLTLTISFGICLMSHGSSACVIGCSCTNDSLGRSLVCMEAPMRHIPEDIPDDFTKIRIENCHLTELPRGSFSKVCALEFLWLNFNEITVMSIKSLEGLTNLTELRLQGNKLTSIPWTVFQDTPTLKILDLKHNRLDVLPEHALKYLPGLTYFDLSFNQISVISKDVFINWPLYQAAMKTWVKEGLVSNVVLALHENPWLCDCRLKGFVEFIREVSPPIILMNSYLMCSGPAAKAGKYFHETFLKSCMSPVASAPETNITLPLGANITLACLVKARPSPTIQWMYSLKIIRAFSVTETDVDEETIRSQLVIPSLHLADRGIYTCMANNFIGNSSVSIVVNIISADSSVLLPPHSPMMSSDENAYIDIRIAKQTVYGITLEWYAVTDNPAETWFTIHFGKYDSLKKEIIYIGPGINSYSVSNLLPVTKYEVCVSLKNHPPHEGQCVVFVTGSDISELEQRERLIHIIVIVCAMVLAMPAGMYACTTEARFSCVERCMDLWRKRRLQGDNLQGVDRQGTFDSMQAASDEGLCKDSEEKFKKRRKSEDRCKGGSAAYLY